MSHSTAVSQLHPLCLRHLCPGLRGKQMGLPGLRKVLPREGAELAFLGRSGLMKFKVPAVSSPHLLPRGFFPFGTFILCFRP